MRLLGLFRKPAGRGVVVGLICALLAWLASMAPVVHGVEEWALAGWFDWRGIRATQAPIVLVELNEESLDALGKPVAFIAPELADVVSYLKQRGAAAIGIDLFVPESMGEIPEVAESAAKLRESITSPPWNVV